MDFSSLRGDPDSARWDEPARSGSLPAVNMAPLKGTLESDPIRSRVLRLLIEDGGWVTTADLLRVARQVRPIIGAVTIGTILEGMNELVSSRLILSRASLSTGIDWAEWRINPDWLEPTRKLLQMIMRTRAKGPDEWTREDAKRGAERTSSGLTHD
ncbi:MAG: hypothetical protein C4K49_06485 [Candidatus Thorarchaeota archaeon]|nr:MAG: hypothetical protein C4K49_06485 [Candidatus Thorarchaeota archaeon]